VQQIPMSPLGAPTQGVQITHGPVVENVTDTTAEIAWSTNVNSGTSLHYGTDPTHLDQTAGMPWGGFTHRVLIKNLKPNTTYYFKAESGQAQGTGTLAEAAQASFQTKPAGATSQIR
jgi:pantothenate kinase